MKAALCPFILIPFFIIGCGKAPDGDPRLKVLFIGNSYTSVNELPSLVQALAVAGGQRIETDEYVPGGYTFEQHAGDKKALEKIREKKWDVVVLQEQSLFPILNWESMHKYARILHEEISKQGAKTVFYLTWARQDIPQMQTGADPATSPEYASAMFQLVGQNKPADFEALCKRHRLGLAGGVNGAYFDIATELNAAVAPVGIAWKKALAADPSLVLHQADKSHPNAQGSYLAACVFYATLFDKSPVGLPGELSKGTQLLIQIAPNEAKMLQEIAWQTVQELKHRHKRSSLVGPGNTADEIAASRSEADGRIVRHLVARSAIFCDRDGEPSRPERSEEARSQCAGFFIFWTAINCRFRLWRGRWSWASFRNSRSLHRDCPIRRFLWDDFNPIWGIDG